MDDERIEIIDFLKRHAPFRELDDATLNRLGQAIDVRYCRAGTSIVEWGQPAAFWHIVRSGVVEVFRRDGTLYNRLTEGGYFGEFGLLHRQRVRFPARALEDTLLYLLPEPVFTELFEQNPTFADHVEIEDRTRLHKAVSQQQPDSPLLSASVESLIQRPPVTLGIHATALDAARCMTETGVSSLLLMDTDADGQARLAGIVTDRDLRARLLAKGLPPETPVAQVATSVVIDIAHHRRVFDAMALMLRHGIHHLPVMRQRQPVGVVALADIIRHESSHSLFVVGLIGRAQTVEELEALVPDVRASFVRMATDNTRARIVGHTMAALGRAFKQRLLTLAEQQWGPPPVPYCFLALGSMARQEQGLLTDQDHALILDNRFEKARHGPWFERLGQFVSDGLARCGYAYCSGGIMASQAAWRQTLAAWEATFDRWIEHPTPEGLLHSNVFFDLEGVHGHIDWADQLRQRVVAHARQRPRFLASMARNALQRTPPLGFFKGFVLEPDGRHTAAINLKRRGTAPLTDLIRVHALAVGSVALNSWERLDDVMAAGILPPQRGPDLRDALEFLSGIRLRTQADDVHAQRPPGNSVAPDQLSEFERRSLRDAFTVLSQAQDFMKYRYGA